MKAFGRLALLALLATSMGCASTAALPPHKFGAAALTTGFEPATVFSCIANTGSQVVFTKPKLTVSAQARGGFIWAKVHSPADVPGTLPTSPIPAAGAVAVGWFRVPDGSAVTFGTEWPSSVGSTSSAPLADQILFLDVWCETGGSDLLVVDH